MVLGSLGKAAHEHSPCVLNALSTAPSVRSDENPFHHRNHYRGGTAFTDEVN